MRVLVIGAGIAALLVTMVKRCGRRGQGAARVEPERRESDAKADEAEGKGLAVRAAKVVQTAWE